MNLYRGVYALLLVLLTLSLTAPSRAQSTQETQATVRPATAPSMSARFGEASPELDGDVLNDPAWILLSPTTGFWQTMPNEGDPASERTEVRILFTEKVLYVGVICFDEDPGRIVVSDSRRDASLDETDSFRLIFDTYLDGQNGFVFGTNPAGIEFDAQVSKEGGSGFGNQRQQGGSGGGFNINWDGSWDVFTLIDENGWSAEFAIPFSTLRFPKGDEQTWGVNFQRNIRRRNEQAFWAPLPRQFDLNRVSMAGTLTGLTPPTPRNLQIIPYVLGETRRDFTLVEQGTKTSGDIGGDLKYSLTPSLTLDASYNTDFAQVEVDELQINLDRFPLFFPEKRPFFLENAGLFSVGVPSEIELFFSRRIGIGPAGGEIPIFGGVRLSGNAAGLNVGLLNMQTRSVSDVTPANNFSVARLRKDLPNRSSVGVVFTNRVSTGSAALDNDYNRTLGLDARVGIGQFGMLSGFAAKTYTPDLKGNDYAFSGEATYDSETWLLTASYSEVADNFNPEVGFLQRVGYRKPSGVILYRYRPESLWGLLELRPHVSYRGYWKFDGFQETGYLHIDNHWEWRSGFEVHTGINFTREGVQEAFMIYKDVIVSEGTYDNAEAQLVLMTDQGKKASLSVRTNIGGFFGGNRVSASTTFMFRTSETFTTELSVQHNDVNLPSGDFNTTLMRARISYSFTPRIYVQTLVQYNNQADLWSMNLRLGWLQSANTGLFVVFNQSNDLGRQLGSTQFRSLTIKYTYLFDVLK